MTEFTFTLLDPIKVGEKNINTLRLCAPKLVHKPIVATLQQGLMQAITSHQNDTKEVDVKVNDAKAEITPEAWVMLISSAKDVSVNFFADFCKNFISLLLQPDICFLGDHKLGSGWADRMSNEDFDNVMGEYITHFLLPAVMSAKK